MNLLTIYNRHSESMADENNLSHSIRNYFMSEIANAEEKGIEISKFIISNSDFNIMTISESFRINYNLKGVSKNDPIGYIFGGSLHLKDEGEIESYYTCPEERGYLGISTKDEV